MSQKAEKPILSGQRIKARKRDEKEKNDPTGFRDALLLGLNEAGKDLEAVYKFLDSAGSKLDYRKYGEPLFDILITGGILAPGGLIVQDGGSKPSQTDVCLFGLEDDMDTMHAYEQVFIKLIRRYKYLEKMFEEEMKKVLGYLKGFNKAERSRLARMTGLWMANGLCPPSVLPVLFNEYVVKDNLALDFVMEVFVVWKQERGVASITSALKRAGLENRLMEFFPFGRRSAEDFKAVFEERDLGEIIRFQKAQATQEVKRDLQRQLEENIRENMPVKEVAQEVGEHIARNAIPEHEAVTIIWTTVMAGVEWNKKEELVADQALKHLKHFTPLFEAFTKNAKSELALLLKVQDFCYDNMNFMKVFHKIVLLLYKTDVLSEDVIMKWYREAHSTKGKSVFLEQMKKFVEWLQNAEEESESEDDDD